MFSNHVIVLWFQLTPRSVTEVIVSTESGPGAILTSLPDSALTASSSHSSSLSPAYSRLHSHDPAGTRRYTSWSVGTNDARQWIQADFGDIRVLTAIETQGRKREEASHEVQCVKSFKVSVNVSGSGFEYILDDSGSEKIFPANQESDSESVVRNCLDYVVARAVRLHPVTWQTHISLRWELYEDSEPGIRDVFMSTSSSCCQQNY